MRFHHGFHATCLFSMILPSFSFREERTYTSHVPWALENSPLFCIPLWGESGEVTLGRIFDSSHGYGPLSIPHNLGTLSRQSWQLLRVSGRRTCSFTRHVLWEVSGTCDDTANEASKQLASLAVASEWGYDNVVCTCLQTQLTTELKQRLTKSMPRRRSIGGVFILGKKYLCKKLEGKEGGGHLLEGVYFRDLMVYG